MVYVDQATWLGEQEAELGRTTRAERSSGDQHDPVHVASSATGMPIPNFDALRLECGDQQLADWQRLYAACLEAKDSDLDLVKRLVQEPAVRRLMSIDHCDAEGRTILHIAARGGHRDMMRFLVEERSIIEEQVERHRHHRWINLQDHNRWTPLFFACWWGNVEAAEFLIRFGASMSIEDDLGCTALERAHRGGRRKLLDHLVLMKVIPDDLGFMRESTVRRKQEDLFED